MILPILILLFTICLTACSLYPAASDNEKTPSGAGAITDYIRESELVTGNDEKTSGSAGPHKNPFDSLNIPTQITKTDDTYFIVDCYHDQIIYNDNLKDPLDQWLVMTDEINKGHTLASDGKVYLTDDTENDKIMVFEKDGDSFKYTQKFDDITSRPHYIVYDSDRDAFFAWCSMSGEMYVFRHGDSDTRMYLTDIRRIPELENIYVRSFTIIGDDIYFVSGNSSIIKADLDTFRIKERYPVPSSMAGMIQLTKIDDLYYITISTDDKWDQSFATIIRTPSLEGLKDNEYEDIYSFFIGGGTPYYISEIDGDHYLTEHRVPGHSIWRFRPTDKDISVESIY